MKTLKSTVEKSKPTLFLLVFLLLTANGSGQHTIAEVGQNDTLNALTIYLSERIPKLMDTYNIPGANIALIQNGEIIWVNSFGFADIKHNRLMTTDTYCRVESISKSVTAWGVMKLVEQNDINLDNPVSQYLKSWQFPKSKFATEKITIRQLLSHTSGMPLGTIGVRYTPTEDKPTLRERLTKDAVLNKIPGQHFSYSNTGFNVLELVIEEVTGREFSEYMQQEVLSPLGMNHSSFKWSPTFSPPIPFGYDLNGQPIPVYVYPDKASGGLFATVGDIAKFTKASMTKFSNDGYNVLNGWNIKKIHEPNVDISGLYGLVFDAYGLGHFIERLPNGQKAISHGGQGSGWMTHFYMIPETGDGIVILTNSQRSWPFFGHILNDWTHWSKLPSVGMGKIVLGTKLLWSLIGVVVMISFLQLFRLFKGLISRTHHFNPLSAKSKSLRSIQLVVCIVLFSTYVWSINQDYLMITSIFPRASNWLGLSMLLAALVLLVSCLCPRVNISKEKV